MEGGGRAGASRLGGAPNRAQHTGHEKLPSWSGRLPPPVFHTLLGWAANLCATALSRGLGAAAACASSTAPARRRLHRRHLPAACRRRLPALQKVHYSRMRPIAARNVLSGHSGQRYAWPATVPATAAPRHCCRRRRRRCRRHVESRTRPPSRTRWCPRSAAPARRRRPAGPPGRRARASAGGSSTGHHRTRWAAGGSRRWRRARPAG